MPFDKSGKPITKFGMLGDKHSHPAVILKRTLADGQIKVFQDPKGLAEKTEISLEEGKIVITKDYEVSESLVHYKKIEVYSNEGTLRFTIDIFPEDRNMPHPVYRFYYQKSELGKAYGDVSMEIAQKLLGRNITIRSSNTMVDEEIITTIKELLKNKQI